MWRLGLAICAWRGILHNLVRGHRHTARPAFIDTVILAVWPSYMLTSTPSHNDTYPASAKLPPLRRD